MRIKLTVFICAAVFLLPMVFTACSSGPKLTTDQQEIMENCIELFTRLKVNDHTVLYDNEFPYVHEERDLEEYLAYPAIAAYRADTLLAIEVDSVTI